MRATNGFPGILPFSVAFSPMALIWLSRRLERSPAIYRQMFLSLSFSFSQPPLYRRRFVSFSSFRLIPAAFQHWGSSARTLPICRNLLIASFLDEGWECAASFLAEEISGLDHAIDFHASPLSVFSSSFWPPRRLSRLSGSSAIWTRYLVHRLRTLQLNGILIPALI